MRKTLALGLGLAALVAAPAAAQSAHQFQLGPRLGYIKYDEKTGIKEAAMIGLDGLFNVTRNIGLGFRLDIARPQTDGSFFPTEMIFKDTLVLYAVSQPITAIQYGAKAELGIGGGLGLFVNGSIGGYRLMLDPQVARGNVTFDQMGLGVGGGFSISTGGASRLRFEVQDFVWRKFDRSRLNVVDDRFKPLLFPEVMPAKAPFVGAAHNIHLSLAFVLTPGGER